MTAQQELENLESIDTRGLSRSYAGKISKRKRELRRVLGLAQSTESRLPEMLKILGDGEMSSATLAYKAGVTIYCIRRYIKEGVFEVVGHMPATGDYKQRNRKGPAIVRAVKR